MDFPPDMTDAECDFWRSLADLPREMFVLTARSPHPTPTTKEVGPDKSFYNRRTVPMSQGGCHES